MVCDICLKLDWPAGSRHSTTCAPDCGLPVMAPEITTFAPAFEGLGEEPMVRVPATHGGVQQPADGQHTVDAVVPVAQHTVDAVVPVAQQVVGWQQIGATWTERAPCVGTGQQGGLACGQMIALAGLAGASIESATAATTKEMRTIERRIADSDGGEATFVA